MDRRLFLEALPKGSVGIEVGVWWGDFSSQVLSGVQPERLHLVDPWERNDDETNRKSTMETTQERLDEVFACVCVRFKHSPVNIYRGRSVEVAAEWTEPVDWVYIDGIHTYEAVKADLAAWWPHVKPGGHICGHDLWVPGVLKAAWEFAGSLGMTQLRQINGNFLIPKEVVNGSL